MPVMASALSSVELALIAPPTPLTSKTARLTVVAVSASMRTTDICGVAGLWERISIVLELGAVDVPTLTLPAL